MGEVSAIGLDLAKNVFQVHGADVSGAVVFRTKLRRGRLLEFFARRRAQGLIIGGARSASLVMPCG